MPIILKPGREKSLLRRHPWIFSGAIERVELERERRGIEQKSANTVLFQATELPVSLPRQTTRRSLTTDFCA